jgi:hypothetical protein
MSPYSEEASATANNNPSVTVTAPTDGASFIRPVEISLTAAASDVDGTVSLVEFFDFSSKIGESVVSPYTMTWSNPPFGAHALSARATDNLGGVTGSAPVTISVYNRNPTIALTSPSAGSVFQEPGTIQLAANASDLDGTITRVDFYCGGTNLIGTATTEPFAVSWTNVPGGAYTLTATATDNDDATSTSAPVSVIVNLAPTVLITSPAANERFSAPATVSVTVNASDPDGAVAWVEFYEDVNYLGASSNSPFSFTLSNISAGTYSLRAVAYDGSGASGSSAPVQIQVSSDLESIADAHARGGNQAAINFGMMSSVEVQTSTANNTRVGFFKFQVPPGLSTSVA